MKLKQISSELVAIRDRLRVLEQEATYALIGHDEKISAGRVSGLISSAADLTWSAHCYVDLAAQKPGRDGACVRCGGECRPAYAVLCEECERRLRVAIGQSGPTTQPEERGDADHPSNV